MYMYKYTTSDYPNTSTGRCTCISTLQMTIRLSFRKLAKGGAKFECGEIWGGGGGGMYRFGVLCTATA